MKVSFVIPCYNSQKTIGKLIDMTCEQMEIMDINDYEFVLVNDYSKDERFVDRRDLFMDSNHLNKEGAEYFTKIVKEEVLDRYLE